MKREEFRNKFFSCGIYSIMQANQQEKNSYNQRNFEKRRKIFGVFSPKKVNPWGIFFQKSDF